MREEYAEEEAEAAELEAAENAAALEVSLSPRITRELDEALKRRSAQEQVSPPPRHWSAGFSATLSVPRTNRS
ncbi:MAG TPA: hypothetical protein VFO16_14525 [Pseudonocardiaceae bacterium]|nr:hypothetical protein [Pseudonocardiaceae bacterium]